MEVHPQDPLQDHQDLFLSSFCKLTLKEKLKSLEPSPETKSSQNTLHHQDQMDICNDNKGILNGKNIDSSPASSTKLFVLESLAKGLPIIPFNYPTFNIIEKKPTQRETQPTTNEWAMETPDMPDKCEQISSHSEPSSRTISRTKKQYADKFSLEEKSLEKLLGLAKREMVEEANLKKVIKAKLLIISIQVFFFSELHYKRVCSKQFQGTSA